MPRDLNRKPPREPVSVCPQGPSSKTWLICLTIVCVAFGVRLLQWQNDFLTLDKNMTRLTARYKEEAQFLLAGDLSSFVKGSRSQPDTMILSHPPGYPIVIAAIYKLSGNSDRALRLFQIACEAVTVMLVFLIAARLVPRGAAVVAALLAALAPQLAYRSLVLLPDSISALPLLAAIFLITKVVAVHSVGKLFLAGGLIGVAAWLRPDAVLLPLFFAAALLLLLSRDQRWRSVLALIGGAVIVVAPITIRNALVFRSFVPITLGTGQNLTAGIGDYDTEQRFGLSATDDGTCAQEAEWFGRPDYASQLYRPDGIERDSGRTARALAVIQSEPVWFVGTIFRRVATMLEYERVSIISTEPTVSHALEITPDTPLVWLSEGALRLEADDTPKASQLVMKPIAVKKNFDYLLTIPVSIQQGRLSVIVRRLGDPRVLASAALPDSLERVPYTNAFAPVIQIPFVSQHDGEVQIAIANVDAPAQRAIVDIGRVQLNELGPASHLWTRYPRLLVKSFQKLFVTRYFLPLTILGVVLLAIHRRKVALALILTLPLYYLSAHAPFHFEYRYILPVYFFWFMLAGLALYWLGVMSARIMGRLNKMRTVLLPSIAFMMVIAALVTAPAPAHAEQQDVFAAQSLKEAGALSVEQGTALRAKMESIIGEAAKSFANEWAGTYQAEDDPTSGAQLHWAPENGFVVWWNTCSHSWRDKVNFGSVDFRDGNLRVMPQLGREGGKVYALPRELITVKWGEQHFLVPLDQLIAFCYAARNAERSREINEFFLKQGDRDKRRFGLPAVPSHYRKYLVGPPIQATIVEVKQRGFTLNVGRTAGVVPGMKFFAVSPGNVYMLVEVTDVRGHTADAYAITLGFKNHSEKELTPRAGWKLTSRAPKRAYEYYPG